MAKTQSFVQLGPRAACRGCLLLVCLGILPLAGAQGVTGSSAQTAAHRAEATDAFRAGSAAFAAGDLPGAQAAFARAVKLAPDISAAHSALGAVLLTRGDAAGAAVQLREAHRLDPAAREATLSLAVAESQLGSYADSANLLHELEAGQPESLELAGPEQAVPLATALSATGDLPGADALLTRVAAAHPRDAALADALGTVEAAEGRYPVAEQTLRSAVRLNPDLPAAHFHLGAVLLETHRAPAAVEELTRARILDPRSLRTTLELARALEEAGQGERQVELLEGALAAASQSKSADPQDTTELRYRLALALQASDQFARARPLFTAVLAARPTDAEALTNAGLNEVQLGDAPAGIALYRRAMELAPADATLREDLGVAYLQQNDLAGALEQFRAGLARDPESPQLHYDLGLTLKLKDDLPGAIPEFERAAQLDPTLPDPPYTLGVIFMQQGKFAEAAERLEQATTLRPDNGDAWATLGSVYRQQGRPDLAEPALTRAIALLPDQPSPHITLAAIYSSQGKKEEAARERKLGADLTRVAVSRQKANFAIDSGSLLLKRGQTTEALAQFADAVAADPGYPAAHIALATGLEAAGRKTEAATERQTAKSLEQKAAAARTP